MIEYIKYQEAISYYESHIFVLTCSGCIRVLESIGAIDTVLFWVITKGFKGHIFGTTDMESNSMSNAALLTLIRCNLLHIMK